MEGSWLIQQGVESWLHHAWAGADKAEAEAAEAQGRSGKLPPASSIHSGSESLLNYIILRAARS